MNTHHTATVTTNDTNIATFFYGHTNDGEKQPSRMNLLLRAHCLEGEESDLGTRALEMVETTLKAMAKGGIYDHLFDGFAR